MCDCNVNEEEIWSRIQTTEKNVEDLQGEVEELTNQNKKLVKKLDANLKLINRILAALAEGRVREVFFRCDGRPEFTIDEH